jgi:hypothetical protein
VSELLSPLCPLSSCRAHAPADCQASSRPHGLHSDPRGRSLSCGQQTELFRWIHWMSHGSDSTFPQRLVLIQHCSSTALHTGVSCRLYFCPEDGGRILLQNVRIQLLGHNVSYPRRTQSKIYKYIDRIRSLLNEMAESYYHKNLRLFKDAVSISRLCHHYHHEPNSQF